MRLFIAVDIDSRDARNLAHRVQSIFRNRVVRATYPRLEDLHITLKFLGEVDRSIVDEIVERLTKIDMESFDIKISGIGGFPSLTKPRIVFLDVDDLSMGLSRLYSMIESELEGLFSKESRAFKPHITVVRIKQFYKLDDRTMQELKAIDSEVFYRVTLFKLKESRLTPSGPIYSDVAVFNLR